MTWNRGGVVVLLAAVGHSCDAVVIVATDGGRDSGRHVVFADSPGGANYSLR